MYIHQKRFIKLFILPLILGAILPFAFAPFNIWPLAILSPALLLLLWQNDTENASSASSAFWQGFSFGIGMFGVGVSWVFVSIHRFGGTDIPLALLITAGLVFLMALFPAVHGYILKRYFAKNGTGPSFWLLKFPSSWVLFEWFRSIFLTGFPWLFLGYAGLSSPFSGLAPIGSVYAVSLAFALTAGALVAILRGNRIIKLASILMILILVGGSAYLSKLDWTNPYGMPKTVSLVQANISPMHKFDMENPIQATEELYGKLTAPYWGSDLILWPEGAIPLPVPYVDSYLQKLDELGKASGSTLITGIQVIKNSQTQYNSLIALGKGSGVYHKHHLLPFGDFLPFEQWLRGLTQFFDLPMSSFSAGDKEQELIRASDLKLNPEICYEIAFPELIRDTLKDAHAIITLSEDGWFGDSYGPHQHLQIARMRALETGRPVIRSTTSGITAIIDAKGQLLKVAPQFQAIVLTGSFQGMQGTTPWLNWGLWPWLMLCTLAWLIPDFYSRRMKKKYSTILLTH